MLSKLFTNWPVVLDTETGQGGTPVYVNVQTLMADSQLVSALARSSGAKYASFGFLRTGSPIGQFTSFDLKEFFDAVGIEELDIDNGGSGDGVKLYFQKYKNHASREAYDSSEHMSILIGNGTLFPVSLSMPNQGDAILTASIIALSADGSTHPFVFSETADLPSGINPDVDALFTMGKVDLNGTEVQGKSQVTVNFGANPTTNRSADSDIYPTHVSLDTFTPTIQVVTNHIDITSTLTEEGAYYTASQVTVYAKKRAEGSSFVPDGTAEHIKFTLGKCRVDVGAIDGDPKNIELNIMPWDSPGGVAQMAINTASQIT